MMQRKRQPATSWEKAKDWYDSLVGAEGQYYHRELIIPNLLKLWNLAAIPHPKVLDLGCGQGILARHLPQEVPYLGIDIAPSFIKLARQRDPNPLHRYITGDISQPLLKTEGDFSHAAAILVLQNLDKPDGAIKNAAQLLREGGILTLVINHPAFRIPRQSSWGIDERRKIQYRRVDCYMSRLKIPIQIHPGKPSQQTALLSYHWPLSQLCSWLKKEGFLIQTIEEWCSPKQSTGSKARMENKARCEFPLFMAIQATSAKS
jgi:ubiquinone/menaquinone biosynthesis C-methylase UbiE